MTFPWVDIPNRWPKEHDNWEHSPNLLKLPNGETMVGFQERLLKEVYRIINDNEGKTVVIVTHGTAIKALKCKFSGIKLKDMVAVSWCENTAVTVVDYDSEKDEFDIKMDGDSSHLPMELKTIVHQEWWQNLNNKARESN